MHVMILMDLHNQRSRRIGQAMMEGIRAAGDKPVTSGRKADVVFSYGWKKHAMYRAFPAFVYADLGYWDRDNYTRFAVNDWGAEHYVRQGLPAERFERLGLKIKPWRTAGKEIIVAGHSPKSARDHGQKYQQWEKDIIAKLKSCGYRVVYRPKPNDRAAVPIPGVPTDTRPISESLASAYLWVAHHSNSAVDALLAGVPVYCEIGAAAAMSITLDQVSNPPLHEGREQFLCDVAWLQWTYDEMRSGECWRHLRQYI